MGPVVLHWGWEMDAGWADLERLAERIAPYAVEWDEFRGAIQRSRYANSSSADTSCTPSRAARRRSAG